jgi:hypothetical protein
LINELENSRETCCNANNAKCLACVAYMIVKSYYNIPEDVLGCEKFQDICCMAMNTTCHDCNECISEEEYCFEYPSSVVCNPDS